MTAERKLTRTTKCPLLQSRVTVHDCNDDVRDVDLEALGNKASPRERCPRGRGASASHRTVQTWMDSTERKTASDGTPEPKSGPTAGRKEQQLRERADEQRVKRAWPTAGRQGAISLQSQERGTSVSHIKVHQTQCTHQDRGDARCDGTRAQAPTVQTVLKAWKLSSRSSSTRTSGSLSRCRGSLDSEDCGDSSVGVHR